MYYKCIFMYYNIFYIYIIKSRCLISMKLCKWTIWNGIWVFVWLVYWQTNTDYAVYVRVTQLRFRYNWNHTLNAIVKCLSMNKPKNRICSSQKLSFHVHIKKIDSYAKRKFEKKFNRNKTNNKKKVFFWRKWTKRYFISYSIYYE